MVALSQAPMQIPIPILPPRWLKPRFWFGPWHWPPMSRGEDSEGFFFDVTDFKEMQQDLYREAEEGLMPLSWTVFFPYCDEARCLAVAGPLEELAKEQWLVYAGCRKSLQTARAAAPADPDRVSMSWCSWRLAIMAVKQNYQKRTKPNYRRKARDYGMQVRQAVLERHPASEQLPRHLPEEAGRLSGSPPIAQLVEEFLNGLGDPVSLSLNDGTPPNPQM